MFERFWKEYPRKTAKRDAEKAWGKIPAHKQIEVIEATRKHALMWKQQGTEKQYIPYPASWIRGERWEDEIEVPPEMPQCDWNRGGMRDVSVGRCEAQAVKEHEGQHYCGPHCIRLGLKFLKAA